jgi:hypothetical protein
MSDEPRDSYLASYEEHSRTLRTWLVAYGAGVPLLLLSNEKLWQKLAEAGRAPAILKLFLFGIAVQTGLAALNKLIMWTLYYGELKPEYKRLRRFRFAEWLSDQIWIDFSVDVLTVLVFAVATQRLARIVLT